MTPFCTYNLHEERAGFQQLGFRAKIFMAARWRIVPNGDRSSRPTRFDPKLPLSLSTATPGHAPKRSFPTVPTIGGLDGKRTQARSSQESPSLGRSATLA